VSNGFEAITLFKEEENEPQKAFPRFLILILKEEGEAVLSFLDNGHSLRNSRKNFRSLLFQKRKSRRRLIRTFHEL
jgi:hypothetical protein